MEKDFSSSVQQLLPVVDQLVQSGQHHQALDQLHALEKKTRSAADLSSTSQLLIRIVEVCADAQEWALLEQEVTTMTKKHGQLKQAMVSMVQRAMEFVPQAADQTALIEGLRTVTEGKIHLEVERARLTRMRVKILEDQGKVKEACDVLQEIQVETYGSMERREKTEFILEQMRLCLAKQDFVRMAIISNKINPKYFQTEGTEDLKLRFYRLMIEHDLHEEEYLAVFKHYQQIYQTKGIKDDAEEWPEVLQNMVMYLTLSPYDNEQSDLMHRLLKGDHNLEKLELCTQLIKSFKTMELTRWPAVESLYGKEFRQTEVFGMAEAGNKRWQVLRDRLIEHNIRVIAQYYTRATLVRLTELLDLGADEVEKFISKAVVDGTIYARIDRPAGLVVFGKPRDAEDQLNGWASDVSKLLGLVEKTTHLIAKEEIVHKIARSI